MLNQIEQLLTGNLSDAATQKLNAALVKLQGLLHSGSISQEVLAVALADAVVAISAANAENAQLSPQQKIEKLWHEVEHYNKEIEDGFEKMRKAGIVFDQQLWTKHTHLAEDLQSSPHDLAKQKELDAVDDALLREAEPQLGSHPEAKEFFNDVKKESEQRHKAVDQDLEHAQESIKEANTNTDLDWEKSGKDVTLNDVEPQNVGAKNQSSQKFVRKQTNVCFRTKLSKWCRFFLFRKITKP